MKIILDDYSGDSIEIHEYIEPQKAYYAVIQGSNKVEFTSEFQVKEFINAFKFLIDDSKRSD